MMKSMNVFLHLLHIVLLTCSYVYALPIGFIDEGVTYSGSPMAATFVANPRNNGRPMMIIVSKEGVINVLEDPDNSDVILNIGNMQSIICTNGSRGVFSIVAHPNFLTNRYLYLYFTGIAANCPADATTGTKNRVSRFEINTNTLQLILGSELVLLENAPSTYLHHDGGAMSIGNDRNIYLAIGDGGSIQLAQDLRRLNGKLIRIDLNGNVPAKNPFTVASGGKGVNCRDNMGKPPPIAAVDAVCEEIYSSGFRNPFRMGLDVNTVDKVRFAIADVGKDHWDEINYGGSDFKGKNYGWPTYEGPCIIDRFDNCPRQVGYQEPFYYYQYRPVGAAATGSVFIPNGVWPVRFKYMFADHVEGIIVNLAEDRIGCRNCLPPRPARRNETFHTYERIVDLFFGPYQNTQAMYYVSRKAVGQNIRRIRFVGGTNRPPIAVISLAKKIFALNEAVTFVGSNSTDPNGDRLTYVWNFGDGRTSTLMNPTVSFNQFGPKLIELTVTDSLGLSSNVFETISIGTPPAAVVESPVEVSYFSVGEVIRLRGRGRDLNTQQPVDASRLFWDVQIRHAGHFHPFMSNRSGNDFDISPAPAPEDFTAAINSHLQVSFTVVDSYGISRTIIRNIFPRKVPIDIISNVPGLSVLVGDFNVVTPATITAWQNQNLKLEAVNQGSNVFQSWNIGGGSVTNFIVPPLGTVNPQIVATFQT